MECLMLTDESSRFGLSECTIAKIIAVFAAVPEIEQVLLYGSRAKGSFRNGSDIDLVVRGGAVSHSQMLLIENQLDDLLLPYSIDLSLLHEIHNPDLIEHIARVGILLYNSANLQKLPV
jgi:predicted nucleotidyltransferase